MRVVLDTNVLLVSVSSRSRLYWLYESFLASEFILCVTTEVLAEYAEIMTRHMGSEFCDATLDAITSAANTRFISPTYRFNLLNDPDDNKFVDCAIAANAVCLVSHDRDFLPLRAIEFPKVAVVDTAGFRELLTASQ
ncbi:MAG: putative toxin-antitoxin system toxin component, PIN family [Hymenobacter sp.]|nr:MAG: putative toxin-antitoxin system toxin component, PIN family [Hymenobacter sp.]